MKQHGDQMIKTIKRVLKAICFNKLRSDLCYLNPLGATLGTKNVWLNASQQVKAMELLPLPSPQWKENWKEEAMLVGCDENSLLMKTK